jgi:hypothetical protein
MMSWQALIQIRQAAILRQAAENTNKLQSKQASAQTKQTDKSKNKQNSKQQKTKTN